MFVPGVYSDKYQSQPANLPWARPFSPSFGGGAPNPENEDKHVLNDEVGWCSVPHAGTIETGAQVFVFFENGDINFPVYLGVAQSGEGWFSEHPNQHCFRSDNVRVRIDENVTDPRSTCKFDSYSTNMSKVAKKNLERDCDKYGWKFNQKKGAVDNLETRIDIEIEASKMNAVNLNIHGNVNLHIDGDWFVEHIGNKYEYHEGDLYINHKGHTYIEEEGQNRKVHYGNNTIEHHGHYTENHIGDTLVTKAGTVYEQYGNDVTTMINGCRKTKVSKNDDLMVGADKILSVGKQFQLNVVDDAELIFGGHFVFNVDDRLDLKTRDDFTISSRHGNIVLKTEGEFELMKGRDITAEGFKNLGTKGNIEIISTFGNINIQCVKNDNLARFDQKTVVVPWNPDFVREVTEYSLLYPDFSAEEAALKAANLIPTINSFTDFIDFFASLKDLLILDGLPVFLPARMIIQNPNVTSPKNAFDYSWIPTFRSEPDDWRSIREDVMWKLPGRLMGNINIETWSGDINVQTKSELGCAGNINIKAEEKLGTFNGYKVGTINFENSAPHKVFEDPRDLFLDSDFYRRSRGRIELFKHGSDILDGGPVLPSIYESILNMLGFSFKFYSTNYDRFYDMYGMNIATHGFSVPYDALAASRLKYMKTLPPPKLGCSKCISDYFMGIPGLNDMYFKTENLTELKGGYHKYGFQRLNPEDKKNPRGVFNILAGDFDKISLGDGHAIGCGFMESDYSSTNIGGMTFKSSGNVSIDVGNNLYKTINSAREKGKTVEKYEFTPSYFDYNVPTSMKSFIKLLQFEYKVWPSLYVEQGVKPKLAARDAPKEFEAAGGYKQLEDFYDTKFKDNGFTLEHSLKMGETISTSEFEDHRQMLDYGFDFEKSRRTLLLMYTSDIETNLKECESFKISIDRGCDQESHSGGNSRYFQVKDYNILAGNTHVEASANFGEHKYVFKSGQWFKSHSYDDGGVFWWDDSKFALDLVPWFPDSEFTIVSNETSQLWNEMNDVVEHHSWSKYGNHIVGPRHPNYNGPLEKCGSTHIVKEGGEPLVNSAQKLWGNKKGAGVEVKVNKLMTANQLVPHHFTLNSANCRKNQSIEISEIWNAPNNIYWTDAKTAGDNLFSENFYKADVNRHHIFYNAAVNSDLIVMNSDHVALCPVEEVTGGTMMGLNDYILKAGNIAKREMIGNQQYFNFWPKASPLGNTPDWEYDKEYSNNYEVTQNGFPINRYKVLNGTNTKIPYEMIPDWYKPQTAKHVTNEMVFSNGGQGDNEAVSSQVVTYSLPGEIVLSGTPVTPISEKNSFFFANGINNGWTESDNAVIFENGTSTYNAKNDVAIENGGSTIYGHNNIRIDNKGGSSTGFNNIISINNNNSETMTLSEEFIGPSLSGFYLTTSQAVIEANGSIDAKAGLSMTMQTLTMTVNTVSETHNATTYTVNSYYLNESAISTIDVRSTIYNLNAYYVSQNSNYETTTVDLYTINSTSLNMTMTEMTVDGNIIKVTAPFIGLDKVYATGRFWGHLEGSMKGDPMNKDSVLPIWSYYPYPSIGHVVETKPPQSTIAPPANVLSPITIPVAVPVTNPENTVSQTLMSVVKKWAAKFIELELSLLATMKGK